MGIRKNHGYFELYFNRDPARCTRMAPVSSKGVEALIMVKFYNKTLSEALVLALWLHIGTLLAAMVYFKMDKFNFAGNTAMLLIAFFLILTGIFQA